MSATAAGHSRHVLLLYKSILKLHRALPLELRAIGDAYAREEFKRHKEADQDHSKVFMQEWTKYAITLSRQVQRDLKSGGEVGASLGEKDLEDFSGEQIAQLYELYQESSKPVDGDSGR